jgi:hypothetical protein
MTDTKKITAAENHLLVAFAHCENTPLNGAPMQAQQPSDLCTWVWLDDRKVGDMTTPQKKGVLASLVKKGLVVITQDSNGDLIGWTDEGFAVLKTILGQPLPALAAPKATLKAGKAAPAPKTNRKPGADVILFLPAESQKEPKAGSKRATIIDLLRAPTGATVEDIAAATGWSRSVAQSALYVDVKGLGHGVERKDGRLFLLPEGGK